MKKKFIQIATLLFLSLVAITSTVTAQSFKPFRIGVGLGYASASGEGASGGVLFYLEPTYALNDKISLGLKLESAIMARGLSDLSGTDDSFDVAGVGSYTLNGKYYFNTNSFRPYVGVGFGLYSLAAVSVTNGNASDATAAESKFGFYPRIGFDAGHFDLYIDYNIVGNTKAVAYDSEFKNSYLGIHVGFHILGGKI